MSTWDEMYADVVTLTKRPDRAEETTLALKTATRNAHFSAHYPRDIVTQLVQLPNQVYLIALDVQTQFPRLRDFNIVRLCDVNYSPVEYPEIEIKELGDIYNPEYRTLLNNIAYVAGTSFNVRSDTGFYGLLVEYFAAPVVNPDNGYNSWIAQLAPDAIIFDAAATVCALTGDEEKAARYKQMVEKVFIPQLQANFLLGQGR